MRKLFTLVAVMFSMLSMASVHVSGVVVDEKGEPVIGASIAVQGTSVGTISDYDGNFELDAPDDAKILVISFVGLQSQEVKVQPNVKVTLRENTEVIQEVVVTGYGNISKGSFAGSAQAVDAENIEKKHATEITKALAGEVAGVQVINTSGQPGTNATLVIRGVGSLNGSATPLYVVDGVVYNGDISSIDPGDIASTNILKDASATALYGSRGANGVVVITTKKGNANDKDEIEVNVDYGGNMRLLPMYETITSPEEYVTMAWMSLYNMAHIVNGAPESKAIKTANTALYSESCLPTAYNLWNLPGKELINPYDNNGFFSPSFNTNAQRRPGYENLESWYKSIFRVGNRIDASVRFSGGKDKLSYYTSFGYNKDEGYYWASDFSRFNVRSNLDYQPKKWFKASLNIAYAYSDMNNPNQDGGGAMNNGFFFINAIPPIYPVYLRNPDGTIAQDARIGGPAYDYGDADLEGKPLNRAFGFGINPAGALRLDKQQSKQHQLDANALFEIKFYKDLKFTATVGVQYLNALGSQLTNKYYGDAGGLGRILQQSTNLFFLEAKQQFDYLKTIGDHTITAWIGHETQMYQENYLYGYKSMLADPNSTALSNAVRVDDTQGNAEGYTMDSYYAYASYNYKERYLIQANYRADGSSRYAKGHRWGHFGGVGAAWTFTNEEFLSNVKWLKDGKLRLSWGVNGNQISSLYAYTDLYALENFNDEISYIWGSKGNPDITWERSQQIDLGLETKFGKWVDFEFDFFHKITDNMLFYRAVAPSLGYSSIPTNDAKMVNQGEEFSFNIHAVQQRNVKLDIRLNGAHYKNWMTQMPVDYYDADGKPVRMLMSGAMSEGHSMYDHYTYVYGGVDDEGNALYQAFYDPAHGGFGDPYTDEGGVDTYNYIPSKHQYELEHPEAKGTLRDTMVADLDMAAAQYVGKSYLPDFEGGLGLSLEVYGVTLNVSTSYRIGGYGYDYTYMTLMGNESIGKYNWHVDMRNAWTQTNTNTDIPRLSNGVGEFDQYANAASTRFLTSNSYFSLNSIQLGYNFPKKLIEKAKMNKLELYVSANNLAIATARKGYNPMTSFTGDSDTHAYSPLSTIMGGIKVVF